MITQDSISRVIDASVIEDVVADYVALKRRGVNMLGLCPFHDEKTPSFTVSPAKGIYKCFGCGKAGNSVSFMMDNEQMTFVDAIKHLGKKFNVAIEETQNTSAEKEIIDHRDNLQVVLNYAANYYHRQLLDTEEGKVVGLSYFKQRNLNADSINLWQLGFIKDKWSELATDAEKSGYNQNFLQEVGLIKKNDKGEWFDIFRDRVIFPIHNAQGKVVAFAGRVLKSDVKAAKYLNSPETDFYKKSNILYGLHLAKKAIRKEDKCLLTEGYLDVISLYQHGIENVVAASGTAFTEGQAKLIKRFTENVTMLFDGDAAGIKAAFRTIDILLTFGFNVRVVPMPDGEDPDSLCQSLGGNKFSQFLVDNEKDFIIYKSELLMNESKDDPIKKSQFVQGIIASIALIKNMVKRAFYIKECATLMGIDESLLFQELNNSLHKESRNSPDFFKPRAEAAKALVQNKEQLITEGLQLQEKKLIKMLLLFGELQFTAEAKVADYMLKELEEDETIFTHELARQVMEAYKENWEKGEYLSEKFFINQSNNDLVAFIADILTETHDLSAGWIENEVFVRTKELNYTQEALSAVYYYKLKKANQMLDYTTELLVEKDLDEEREVLKEHKAMHYLKRQISQALGNVVG